MPATTLADSEETKAAAQYLLRQGLATYAEIARISGRSREIVRHWAIQLNAESAREDRVAALWEKAIRKTE